MMVSEESRRTAASAEIRDAERFPGPHFQQRCFDRHTPKYRSRSLAQAQFLLLARAPVSLFRLSSPSCTGKMPTVPLGAAASGSRPPWPPRSDRARPRLLESRPSQIGHGLRVSKGIQRARCYYSRLQFSPRRSDGIELLAPARVMPWIISINGSMPVPMPLA
jgi:hypothetical protein